MFYTANVLWDFRQSSTTKLQVFILEELQRIQEQRNKKAMLQNNKSRIKDNNEVNKNKLNTERKG